MTTNLQQAVDIHYPELDEALAGLAHKKTEWPRVGVADRIAILAEIKECLMPVAEDWALTASRKKGIPAGSPLEGEEWLSGPYSLMAYCNALMDTLSKVADKRHLEGLPMRELPNGQLAVKVVPHTVWDRLLLSGVSAEVWMQPGVNRGNLARHTASAYESGNPRRGKLALVLGAGNISSIAPLDCLYKLFAEHQVALLKMNPVNEYLIAFLEPALKPLIARGYLRIVRGDTAIGQYLCNHPLVEEIHITGSGAAHDAIVWGTGAEAAANKAAGTPKNRRRVTSELGAVCPTIVVPGPWNAADIAFQAEHIATQKLHNAGFNCVACQVLVMPGEWESRQALLDQVRKTIAASTPRPLYYPGTEQRLAGFRSALTGHALEPCGDTSQCAVASFAAGACSGIEEQEIFGPALSVTELPGRDPEAFLIRAIDYANRHLHGTLGANILIHPATMRVIGRKRFEEILAGLHYGCIAINAWTGLGFLSAPTPWGAFPGHSLQDVQSGIGFVHNTMLFDRPERTVLEAPFTPYPRNLARLNFSMLPRPPWFITNRRAATLGRLLTRFQYRPAVSKLPRLFVNALRG
ncbi:aldehyde dehydrogenase family protein [Noviherbaspirillum aridicola]|uniref:Aldehyde dehydrogenase n=1 Tax=Noviherbaspirillum aridicola TaxID=2849687 RepID=A0ABQ4PZM0_9BURK|nr:aldehyde dehydrogenase family protein [Noviherbaspirillum aridicola]GIZ50348.1 putative aldehyde dehydrogenase [Noviherbaspirillum aridicola]